MEFEVIETKFGFLGIKLGFEKTHFYSLLKLCKTIVVWMKV